MSRPALPPPRHLTAPRPTDRAVDRADLRMAVTLTVAALAGVWLAIAISHLAATRPGGGAPVTVYGGRPPTTTLAPAPAPTPGSVPAGRRAAELGKTPPPTTSGRGVALVGFTPAPTTRPAGPDPRSTVLRSSTTTTIPPAAPPTSSGGDEGGPTTTVAPSTTTTTVPPTSSTRRRGPKP